MNSVTRDLANHATGKCITAMTDVLELCDDRTDKVRLLALITCNVMDVAAGLLAAEYIIATGKPQPPYGTMVRVLYAQVGEAMERKIKKVAG